MRRVVIVRLLASFGFAAAAGASAAQILPQMSFQQQLDLQLRAADLRAQQDLADRRAVIMQNQLNSLEAQVRTQQAMDDLRAQSVTPSIPPPVAGAPPPHIDAGGLAEIPDAALAASNARVKAAAENRR